MSSSENKEGGSVVIGAVTLIAAAVAIVGAAVSTYSRYSIDANLQEIRQTNIDTATSLPARAPPENESGCEESGNVAIGSKSEKPLTPDQEEELRASAVSLTNSRCITIQK